jgi:hypothetical protein
MKLALGITQELLRYSTISVHIIVVGRPGPVHFMDRLTDMSVNGIEISP